MARIANAARFGDNGIGGTWYNPPIPTDPVEAAAMWPQYAARAAWLHARFPTGKIGIAGTGYAWTQYFLFVNHSRQSWGCDIAWAITRAGGIMGAWASFVGAYDVTNATQMTQFRRMGNAGNAKYDVLFTEDLLPCADTEAEAQLMLTRLRAVGTTLVHLITPLVPGAEQTPDMLWRTHEQWRTIIGPTELIVGPDLIEV